MNIEIVPNLLVSAITFHEFDFNMTRYVRKTDLTTLFVDSIL